MSTGLADLPSETANKRVLPTRLAAQFCGISVREWERRKAAGETPAAVELGTRRLGYQISDLIAWIEARKKAEAA